MQPKHFYLGAGVGIGATLAVVVAVALALAGWPDLSASVSRPMPSLLGAEPRQAQAGVAATAPLTLSGIIERQSFIERQSGIFRLATMADEPALLDLLAETHAVIPPSEANWIAPILYARYAELDGAAALLHLRRNGFDPGAEQSALTGLFLGWIRADAEAALGHMAALGPQEKVQVGVSILRLDSHLSASQKQALAERLGLGGYLNQVDLASRLRLTDDPEAQLDELLTSTDYRARQRSLLALMSQWAKTDPEAAMAATLRVSGMGVRQRLQQQVVQQWARADAAAALRWAVAQPASGQRNQYWIVALRGMAAQDPRGAMELAADLEPGQRDAAMGMVLSVWGAVEPRSAVQWLNGVEDPVIRGRVVGQIAQGYARQYPDEAVQWANTLSPAERSRAAQGLIGSLVDANPSLAVSVLGMIDDPQQRASVAQNLALSWAQHEPHVAVEWIVENIAGDQRPQILASAVQQWAQYDTEAALRFADALDGVAEREMVILAVLPYLQSDPVRADAYYQGLTGPQTRQAAAQMLYGYWHDLDPARAEGYRLAAGIAEGAEAFTPIIGPSGRARAMGLMRNPSIQLSR
jgi:hypothetical protein